MTTYTPRTPPQQRPGASETDSLRGTLRGVLRSWPIILLAALIAAGGAVAYSLTRPISYETAASLLFNNPGYQQAVAGGYNPVDAQRRARTSADLIRLSAVADLAAQRLENEPDFHPASASVRPQYSSSSDTMQIVAKAPDRKSAALLANATAAAFLEYRKQTIRDSLQDARRVLRAQIKRAPTKAERRLLVGKRNNLDAMEALDNDGVQIVQPAAVPGVPIAQETVRNGLIAAVLGLLVGVAIALLRMREPEPPPSDPWADENGSREPS